MPRRKCPNPCAVYKYHPDEALSFWFFFSFGNFWHPTTLAHTTTMSIGKLLSNGALLVDVLIIGAGPAGLSTATGLARQLHTAVVFDSGVYRNAKTQHMHNVLGWDHRNPAELRAAGRADLTTRYSTIQFQNSTIEAIRQVETNQLFEARDNEGHSWYGRKVVLATGVRDIPLDIEGYSECWANGIYHCLFCDGYEERGQETVGVLALGPIANPARALHLARMALRLSESVTIYTNGNEQLAKEIQQAAEESPVGASGLKFEARPIRRFEKGDVAKTVIVHLGESESKTEGFLVRCPVCSTEISLLTAANRSGVQPPNGGQWTVCQAARLEYDRRRGYPDHAALL